MKLARRHASLVFALLIVVTGCSSTQELKSQAKNHDKAREYYESIGQPQAAQEEGALANQKRDRASDADTFFVSFFQWLMKKDK